MKRIFKSAVFCIGLLAACAATALAQRGEIAGRVVTEDGGMPNVTVMLFPAGSSSATRNSATTDEDGNFKFSNLPPRSYSISVFGGRGYVRPYLPIAERRAKDIVRVGENVTVTLIRGGVITGHVTTAAGEPMIGVRVTATMVKDPDGQAIRQGGGQPRPTDDRGIYRLYGLAPGTYIVSTQNAMNSPSLTLYEGNVATYYPSATRDTAAEVTVGSGGEVTGVDIRFRGERGHAVSGTVSGGAESSRPFGISVNLHSVQTGAPAGQTGIRTDNDNSGFAIHGVLDGEYDVVARRGEFENEDGSASPPRRITVRGADVSGVELKLAPLATIAGKVAIETAPAACESKRKSTLEELLVTARRAARPAESLDPFPRFSRDGGVSDKGEFSISNLDPGRYFLETRLPNENWYLKAIATTAKPAAGADAARNGFPLKSGENVSGVTVTIADGASGLSGKVVAAKAGASLPARMRVHLVPAEATVAGDVPRYAETLARGDASFTFGNLAPGRYLLLARILPDGEAADRPPMPATWDAVERAKLRKDAEAKKIEIELKPCQQVNGHSVRW